MNDFGTLAPALEDMKPSELKFFRGWLGLNPDVKYFIWAGHCTVGQVPKLL